MHLLTCRQLGAYKDYVKNKYVPEGCIAEAYVAHECVTYTNVYLGALEDPQQQMPIDEPQFNLSIISNDVVVHGSLPKSYKLDENEVVIAHWSVLINCQEVQYWKNYHLHCPAIAGNVDYHNKTFANYFGQWVSICVYVYFYIYILT